MLKMCQAKVKAAGPDDGLEEGQFTAYASVFGNVDSFGDVVMKGAFADTLANWKTSSSEIPLLWGHNMSDPDYNIGLVAEAGEDDHGLLVTGQLDMESPKAAQVYRLLKGRRVSQMSFAYDIEDAGFGEREDEPVFELRKLKLHEVSVVPVGANQETEVLTVKSLITAASKEGRVLATRHVDRLREAHSALGEVISAAEGDGKSGEWTSVGYTTEGIEWVKTPASTDAEREGSEAKAGEPGNGHSPTRTRTVELSALLDIELAS